MSKVHVHIENPLPGGGDETNANRARRFVRTGQAVFTGPLSIRFLRGPGECPVARRVEQTQEQKLHTAFTGRVYDALDRSHYRDARRIPVIHPEKMI